MSCHPMSNLGEPGSSCSVEEHQMVFPQVCLFLSLTRTPSLGLSLALRHNGPQKFPTSCLVLSSGLGCGSQSSDGQLLALWSWWKGQESSCLGDVGGSLTSWAKWYLN